MGNHFIKDFEIEDYKGIHMLTLHNLNHINILTGNNNSGKTSILELLATVGSEKLIRSWLLGARLYRTAIYYHNTSVYYDGCISLFPVDQKELQIGYVYTDCQGDRQSVMLKGRKEMVQLSKADIDKMNGGRGASERCSTVTESVVEYNTWHEVELLHLELFQNETMVMDTELYSVQNRLEIQLEKGRFPILYVSPTDRATQYLETVMKSSVLYTRLLKILKKFDEGIMGIQAVMSGNGSLSVEYVVLSSSSEQSLPLRFFGDGMQKAVLLLSAVVQAKDGILLLDEFETGIHTSGMNDVFQIVLETAVELNVQVFMTSHSYEAISKVLRLSDQLQDKINLYTLYRHEGKNLVCSMGAKEAVFAQDNMGLELR